MKQKYFHIIVLLTLLSFVGLQESYSQDIGLPDYAKSQETERRSSGGPPFNCSDNPELPQCGACNNPGRGTPPFCEDKGPPKEVPISGLSWLAIAGVSYGIYKTKE